MKVHKHHPTPTDPGPTGFPELNDLLRDLTSRVRQILANNFVGAYLQGSFALGDADMASDCDFLIPVRGPISPTQETDLRAMHDEIPTRPGHWSTALEGSYPHLNELKTLSGIGNNWLYIQRGHRWMEWSTHWNTAFSRWTLRERALTLVGPDPKTFVDEVSADVLRAEMIELSSTLLPKLLTLTTLGMSGDQRYAVATGCRILNTIQTGRVTSKKASLLWAKTHLDNGWSDLIQATIDGRLEEWDSPTKPGYPEAALRFLEYVQDLMAERSAP